MDARIIAGLIVGVILLAMIYEWIAARKDDPKKVADKKAAIADAKKAIADGKAKLDDAKKLDVHKDSESDKMVKVIDAKLKDHLAKVDEKIKSVIEPKKDEAKPEEKK